MLSPDFIKRDVCMQIACKESSVVKELKATLLSLNRRKKYTIYNLDEPEVEHQSNYCNHTYVICLRNSGQYMH